MKGLRDMKGRAFLLLLLGLLLLIFADSLGLFQIADRAAYDLACRLRGERKHDDRIVLVAVDERTLGQLGRWPIRRNLYAELIERMPGAEVIAFDIIMAEPSEGDDALGRAMRRHGKVVFPVYVDDRMNFVFPADGLSPAVLGHIHVEMDVDGVARTVFRTLRNREAVVPALASSMQSMISGNEVRAVERRADGNARDGILHQAESMKIDYFGPPGTFRRIPMIDVLSGRHDASLFKGKFVIVGVTAPGIERLFLTPFSHLGVGMPGVEVQANILNGLLDGGFIRDLDDRARWLAVILLSCGALYLLMRTEGKGAVAWVVCLGSMCIVVYLVFSGFALWVNPTLFPLALTFTFFVAYTAKIQEMGTFCRRAKEDWEETFNSIDDAVVLTDDRGAVISRNAAATMLPPSVCAAPDEEEMRSLFRESGGTTGEREQASKTGSVAERFDPGSRRHFETRTLVRFTSHDVPTGAIVIAKDVTERKKAEKEQQALQFQLTQAQKMEAIGQLAGGIAHDFNNMLTAIIGYGNLLQMKLGADSPLCAYVDQILEASEKSAGLTRQLLTFSRKQDIDLKETDLNKLIRGIQKLLGRIIGEDIDFAVSLADSQVTALVDPGQMEQVLLNLCTNARDAMPNGGSLRIQTDVVELDESYARMHAMEKPGFYALISVEDTGSGMDETTRQKIFEPFYTTKEVGKGTGLGLAIVYGVVKRQNGQIMVYSEPGKGTTFKILLPLVEPSFDLAGREKAGTPDGGTETILVTEDNEEVRSLTCLVLREFGYTVIEAVDGEDAVTKFFENKERIDLVMLDVIMPKKSGREAGDAIRKTDPAVKVLFTSGYTAEIISKQRILDEGADFISKPSTPHELLGKVRAVLDGKGVRKG